MRIGRVDVLVYTHCHLQNFLRKQELDEVLKNAREKRVEKMVAVGTAAADWADYQKLANDFRNQIITRLDYIRDMGEDWVQQVQGLENYWKDESVPIALGEIGLDYFRLPKDKEEAEKIVFWQKEAFRHQLKISLNLHCPVIIHPGQHSMIVWKKSTTRGVDWTKVVFHCFTEELRKFHCLWSGVGVLPLLGFLTFPKNEELWKAAKHQGVDKLLLETDSPYLAPVPYRVKKPARYSPEIEKFASELFWQ